MVLARDGKAAIERTAKEAWAHQCWKAEPRTADGNSRADCNTKSTIAEFDTKWTYTDFKCKLMIEMVATIRKHPHSLAGLTSDW